MTAAWTTPRRLAAARETIAASIDGWKRPAAHTPSVSPPRRRRRSTSSRSSTSVTTTCRPSCSPRRSGTPAAPPPSPLLAELTHAVNGLAPAEACTSMDHPNLRAWREIVTEVESNPYRGIVAVFIGDLDDPVSSEADGSLRTQLPDRRAHCEGLRLLPDRRRRHPRSGCPRRAGPGRVPRRAAGVQGPHPARAARSHRRPPRPASPAARAAPRGHPAAGPRRRRRARRPGSFVATNTVVSQSVPHLHVHVVPRTKGDGLRGFFWPRTKYASDDEAAEYASRLAAVLAAPEALAQVAGQLGVAPGERVGQPGQRVGQPRIRFALGLRERHACAPCRSRTTWARAVISSRCRATNAVSTRVPWPGTTTASGGHAARCRSRVAAQSSGHESDPSDGSADSSMRSPRKTTPASWTQIRMSPSV